MAANSSLSFLATTGSADSKLIESNDDNSIVGTVVKWSNETIKALKESLNKRTSQGTSKQLEQSLVVLPVEFANQKYIITLQAEDYWKFINKGVKGVGGINQSTGKAFKQKGGSSSFSFKEKKPPVNFSSVNGSSLRQWAYNKGLSEYAVRESIFRSGIRATKFFDEVIKPSWTKDLVKRIEKAGGKEISIVLTKDFKK